MLSKPGKVSVSIVPQVELGQSGKETRRAQERILNHALVEGAIGEVKIKRTFPIVGDRSELQKLMHLQTLFSRLSQSYRELMEQISESRIVRGKS